MQKGRFKEKNFYAAGLQAPSRAAQLLMRNAWRLRESHVRVVCASGKLVYYSARGATPRGLAPNNLQ